MNWPVILSGLVSVAMLALGFNLLLPVGSGLEPVCVLTGVASAMVFFGLVDGALAELSKTPGERSPASGAERHAEPEAAAPNG